VLRLGDAGGVCGRVLRLDGHGNDVKFRELSLSGVCGRAVSRSRSSPLRWVTAVAEDHAAWDKGTFADQNSACKRRSRFTLDRLTAAFNLE